MDGGIFQEEPNIFFAAQITNDYLFAFMNVRWFAIGNIFLVRLYYQSIDMQEAQFNSL